MSICALFLCIRNIFILYIIHRTLYIVIHGEYLINGLGVFPLLSYVLLFYARPWAVIHAYIKVPSMINIADDTGNGHSKI